MKQAVTIAKLRGSGGYRIMADPSVPVSQQIKFLKDASRNPDSEVETLEIWGNRVIKRLRFKPSTVAAAPAAAAPVESKQESQPQPKGKSK